MQSILRYFKKADYTIWLICTLLSITMSAGLRAQEIGTEQVRFMNTPLLFSKNGQKYQQLLAEYLSDKSGKITFRSGGKELLSSAVTRGENRFLLTLPAVSSPEEITLQTTIDNGEPLYHKVMVVPPKRWTVYLVQHSHTDIGYTRPQSEILAEQMRYIDYALDYCDQTDNMPDDARFRWSCESSWVTREYIRTRPASQLDRLFQRIRERRIEVTGMFANMSEIVGEHTLVDLL